MTNGPRQPFAPVKLLISEEPFVVVVVAFGTATGLSIPRTVFIFAFADEEEEEEDTGLYDTKSSRCGGVVLGTGV